MTLVFRVASTRCLSHIGLVLTLALGFLGSSWQLSALGAPRRIESARPWLGVAIEPGQRGVLVKSVIQQTPAAAAGLMAGDEITQVGPTRVTLPQELIAAVQALGIGHTVVVAFLRQGKPNSKTITLVARPDELELLRKELEGRKAPKITATPVSGEDLSSEGRLAGRPTVVEFWATWCPACRSTHPRLSEFARTHKGIGILAISDEDEATVRAYARSAQPAFAVATDPSHATQSEWMVTAIPEIVVVDAKGQVAFATVGAGEYLEEALRVAERLSMATSKH